MKKSVAQLFSLPKREEVAWNAAWPADIGVVIKITDEETSFHPYHSDESNTGIMERLSIDDVTQVKPAVKNGKPASRAVGEAIRKIQEDPDVLDVALDFDIAYRWSKSEGAPLEIPSADPPKVADKDGSAEGADEDGIPARSDADIWSSAVPASDVRIVTGAKMRKSVSGAIAIEVPVFSGVEEIMLEDIYVLPGSPGILVREQNWNAIPGTILLPAEVLRHLDVGVDEEVRIMKTENPGWVSFSRERVAFPSLADIAKERDDYKENGRKSRGGGSILGIALVISMVIASVLYMSEKEIVQTTPVETIKSKIFSGDTGR